MPFLAVACILTILSLTSLLIASAIPSQEDYEGSGEQWNKPTSAMLAPGQAVTVGWRLHLAPAIQGRDAALAAAGLAVVQGIPGAFPMSLLLSMAELCGMQARCIIGCTATFALETSWVARA